MHRRLRPGQHSPAPAAGFSLDAKKKPLRRFYDSNGDGKVDVWSYYKDGVEVYREFDTTYKGTPNNFRWLNAGGMKWGVGGVDAKGKAVITSWGMISAEEVGFEAFQAIARQDFARLQTLLITDEDTQSLKLPAVQSKRSPAIQQQGGEESSAIWSNRSTWPTAKFEVVEGAMPQCDTTSDVEIIKYRVPRRPL